MKEADFLKIRELVGDITLHQLRHVDCFVSEHMAVCIPSVGFCDYAILPSHTHPSYSFTLFFSKEQTYMSIQTEIPAHHYAAVAMDPEFPHEEPLDHTFMRYIAIFISKSFYLQEHRFYSDQNPKNYKLESFFVSKQLMIALKQFMTEYENKQKGYEQVQEALVKLITHQFIRALGPVTTNDTEDAKVNEWEITRVLDYMQQHFGEKLTIRELAESVNMSESHFMRVFKKHMHLTPISYLTQIRVEKSKKLLRSNKESITEIALICGFNGASHFSAVFTKQMRITPTAYRELYQNP